MPSADVAPGRRMTGGNWSENAFVVWALASDIIPVAMIRTATKDGQRVRRPGFEAAGRGGNVVSFVRLMADAPFRAPCVAPGSRHSGEVAAGRPWCRSEDLLIW